MHNDFLLFLKDEMLNKNEAFKKQLREKEIFCILHENKRYWIKKARATATSKIQKLIYAILPLKILVLASQNNAKDAMNFEVRKLQDFKTKGINTPEVIYVCDDFFVLEDTGQTIYTLLKDKKNTQEDTYNYINKLLEELSKIHNLDQFHGGTQTRNFTYKNEKIYAIDLEENFSNDIDIQTLKLRDLLLLLLSLSKLKTPFKLDYERIVKRYSALVTNGEKIVLELKKLAQKMSILIYLGEIKWINRMLGKDAKDFLELFQALDEFKI